MATSLEELGFLRMVRLKGRDLKLLSPGTDSGKVLRATVNRIGAYTLMGDLSSDPRGKRIFETAATGCLTFSKNDKFQDVKNLEKYQVVDIGLDSPDYSKKFVVMQLTGKDT
jgi:hypothetical protein